MPTKLLKCRMSQCVTMYQTVLVCVVCVVSVSQCSLTDGDMSGDQLEHFNVHPLTKAITMDLDPVQAVHIALFGDSQIRVTWLNPVQFQLGNFTFNPVCRYGLSPTQLTNSAKGFAYSYEAGDFRLTLNTALLSLRVFKDVHSTMYYICGDVKYGWSSVYHFTYQPKTIVNPQLSPLRPSHSMNEYRPIQHNHNAVVNMQQDVQSTDGEFNKKIVLIADMGVTHATDTMSGIQDYIEKGVVQLLVHAGDISYADNFSIAKHNNSYIWVEYMNELNGISPYVPYMTCPGNHEAQFDFAAYLNWLPMPHQESLSTSHFWYSFDYMGVHFLSFSTEHPFNQSTEQYRFIQQDLIRANQNRDAVPWIIVVGHRPLYCTSVIAHERCKDEAEVYRSYLEDLFHEEKVDVYLCGHNHNYERTYPVYRGNATQKDFHNPKAPVYIVDGAAGNPEPNDPSYKRGVDWRAYVYASVDNGFLLVEPTPKQLHFEYVRSHDKEIIDTFTISKS